MRDAHALFSSRMAGQLPGTEGEYSPHPDPVYRSGAVLGNSAIRRPGKGVLCSVHGLVAGWVQYMLALEG